MKTIWGEIPHKKTRTSPNLAGFMEENLHLGHHMKQKILMPR